MNFQNHSLVTVNYLGGSNKQKVGRLLLKDRTVFFEYTADFLQLGLELSPFKMPLKPGIIRAVEPTFEGLLGVFNDSLPDGWGRLLLERKLLKAGLNPNQLSALDRLSFVGEHGMGALAYEPEYPHQVTNFSNNLDSVAEEIRSFQEDGDDQFVDDLVALGGSSAGARPKILIRLNEKDWLIKFRSSFDPIDIGNIEYAYHLMAAEAGLDLPVAKLFSSKKSSGYFGVQRFDRANKQRIHMHTLSGLLHADHRYPCLDYQTVMKATALLTRNSQENKKQFRNAVFNVLSHNRDDHAKNFSYLMTIDGEWKTSPAYDLTFSSGPGGEHSTLIMGEGKNPGRANLLNLANTCDINPSNASEIIANVESAISRWTYFAKLAGVSKTSSDRIQKALNQIHKNS